MRDSMGSRSGKWPANRSSRGPREGRMILDALAATGDDKLAAAKLLGIGERTLWTKLKKHAI